MNKCDQSVINKVCADIAAATLKLQFSFLNPDEVREFAPRKVVCELMRDIKTQEEKYMPIRIESLSGNILMAIENPGYVPVTKTVCSIEMHITNETEEENNA